MRGKEVILTCPFCKKKLHVTKDDVRKDIHGNYYVVCDYIIAYKFPKIPILCNKYIPITDLSIFDEKT